jgi:hypothetical protein
VSFKARTNLDSEAWHEAVTAITQQAERLVAEPGLWTAVFPLVVICLCFAQQTEFDQLWRFRLEQAMGMLQSPQVSTACRLDLFQEPDRAPLSSAPSISRDCIAKRLAACRCG